MSRAEISAVTEKAAPRSEEPNIKKIHTSAPVVCGDQVRIIHARSGRASNCAVELETVHKQQRRKAKSWPKSIAETKSRHNHQQRLPSQPAPLYSYSTNRWLTARTASPLGLLGSTTNDNALARKTRIPVEKESKETSHYTNGQVLTPEIKYVGCWDIEYNW